MPERWFNARGSAKVARMKTAILLLISIYLAICAGMYFFQRHLLYFPSPVRTAPADADLPDVVERVIKTADGESIIAWYGRAKPGQPTLLYFHGNGGALEVRRERIRKYMNRGRGVFMMSYRGYSGSTGTPTEQDNVADAKRAYDALRDEGVAAHDIIIYGESLGSGVAVQVATDKPVAGLILDSPFTSVLERARELYPWLPVSLLLKDRYESRKYIGDVHVPLLIVHGEKDIIVPSAMGRKLFDLANPPKELAIIPGAGHEDHWRFGSYDVINSWIDRLRTGALLASERQPVLVK